MEELTEDGQPSAKWLWALTNLCLKAVASATCLEFKHDFKAMGLTASCQHDLSGIVKCTVANDKAGSGQKLFAMYYMVRSLPLSSACCRY
jgi:hypothetical protein